MATPLRVLVVDDDPGMRDGMAMSLKRSGFFAEQARGGEEALRMVRPGAYDAVVTDQRMPEHPAPAFCRFASDQIACDEGRAVVTRVLQQMPQQLEIVTLPDDGGRLQRSLVDRRQPVEPRQHHALDRSWNRRAVCATT